MCQREVLLSLRGSLFEGLVVPDEADQFPECSARQPTIAQTKLIVLVELFGVVTDVDERWVELFSLRAPSSS